MKTLLLKSSFGGFLFLTALLFTSCYSDPYYGDPGYGYGHGHGGGYYGGYEEPCPAPPPGNWPPPGYYPPPGSWPPRGNYYGHH